MEKTSKIRGDKFSKSEDIVCEEVYSQLYKFVCWLASSNHDSENIMMEYDELLGELLLEIVKGVAHYKHLEREKLIAVIKRMLDNRISELRYRYYLTHRKAHVTDISLESSMDDCDTDCTSDSVEELEAPESVEGLVASRDVVREVRTKLSPTSRKVFDAVIMGDNDRIAAFVKLRSAKSAATGSGNRVKLTKRDIADIVVLPVRTVHKSYAEIKRVYAEVTHGS